MYLLLNDLVVSIFEKAIANVHNFFISLPLKNKKMRVLNLLLPLLLLPLFLIAQEEPLTLDDTIPVKIDSVLIEPDEPIDVSGMEFITDLSQLPAQDFYQTDWSEEYLRLKSVPIPFVKDEVTLYLDANNFVFPVKNGKVISEYGMRRGRLHTGTDIKQRLNDTVVACFDGVVRMAKSYSGYGKIVVVRHANGLESVYSHLNKILVKPKEVVKAGQVVGLAGRTGRATTEHLHFEFRFLYEHFNSRKVVDYQTEKLVSDTLVLTAKDLHRKNTLPVKPAPVAKDTTSLASDSLPAAAPAPGSNNTSKPAYHTVKQGDTLYKISKKYGVPISQLLKLNNMKETDILSLGRKIKLR